VVTIETIWIMNVVSLRFLSPKLHHRHIYVGSNVINGDVYSFIKSWI